MGHFVGSLEVREAGAQFWELTKPLKYESVIHGEFEIPTGFVTDFASVPRLPFAYLCFGGLGDKAGALHDWLYVVGAVSRKFADSVLLEALIDCGVPKWKAQMMWVAVRAGGGSRYLSG